MASRTGHSTFAHRCLEMRSKCVSQCQNYTPGRQIQLTGPQSEKDYRRQWNGRRRKTLPAAKSRSLGPKARRTTDRNCSDGVEKRSRPPNPGRWAPKREGLPIATAQTASKNAPGRQIQLTGPQSKKDYRPDLKTHGERCNPKLAGRRRVRLRGEGFGLA